MSYRDRFETITVTADNISDLRSRTENPRLRIGDQVNFRVPASKVDLRLFAQLAESLGYPYPDEL